MSLHPTWLELALRLVLATLAGALIGINRGEHGKSAGLRTNLLVCLAATIAMIQVNLLLDTRGRSWDSFMMADPMRLPLGILSGVGFIGGGAILQRRNLVVGVTTAATLWYATVMGLCFGAGHLLLGGVACLFGIGILWGLKIFEQHWKQLLHAELVVSCEEKNLSADEVAQKLKAKGFHAALKSVTFGEKLEMKFDVSWRARPVDQDMPAVLQEIANLSSVSRLQWKI
jgi:putative Mg2+ transporter-C (MgtC) family protein